MEHVISVSQDTREKSFIGLLAQFDQRYLDRGQKSLFHGPVYYGLQMLAIRHISKSPPHRLGIHDAADLISVCHIPQSITTQPEQISKPEGRRMFEHSG